MSIQSRKMHILEEILRINSSTILLQIENALRTKKKKDKSKVDYNEFSGVLTKLEADEMEKVIEETCEKINSVDWK